MEGFAPRQTRPDRRARRKVQLAAPLSLHSPGRRGQEHDRGSWMGSQAGP